MNQFYSIAVHRPNVFVAVDADQSFDSLQYHTVSAVDTKQELVVYKKNLTATSQLDDYLQRYTKGPLYDFFQDKSLKLRVEVLTFDLSSETLDVGIESLAGRQDALKRTELVSTKYGPVCTWTTGSSTEPNHGYSLEVCSFKDLPDACIMNIVNQVYFVSPIPGITAIDMVPPYAIFEAARKAIEYRVVHRKIEATSC